VKTDCLRLHASMCAYVCFDCAAAASFSLSFLRSRGKTLLPFSIRHVLVILVCHVLRSFSISLFPPLFALSRRSGAVQFTRKDMFAGVPTVVLHMKEGISKAHAHTLSHTHIGLNAARRLVQCSASRSSLSFRFPFFLLFCRLAAS
jgi:hypothetical protein